MIPNNFSTIISVFPPYIPKCRSSHIYRAGNLR